ncbi:MAG: hypothetical protein KJ624_05070 [Chloroflexi bacterium]|nr:hypothetical protein [Chloroflexota bacterium]
MKRELKKKWLEEHLDEVQKVGRDWLGQLYSGDPFFPFTRAEDWEEPYQPSIEGDADQNHMLRRHIRSRTLWGYHAKWQQLVREFTALRKQILQEAKQLGKGKGEYWILTALWQAFERAKNPPKSEDEERLWQARISPLYRRDSPPGTGVMFGAFATEESGELEAVRRPHLEMIRKLADLDNMKEALRVLSEIRDLEGKMSGITSHILKAHDILYTCRYCRHLWR